MILICFDNLLLLTFLIYIFVYFLIVYFKICASVATFLRSTLRPSTFFLNRKVRKVLREGRKETKNVCFVNLNLFQILFSLRCWNKFSKTKSWRVNLVIFCHELARISSNFFKSFISSSIIYSSTFDFKTFDSFKTFDIWPFFFF